MFDRLASAEDLLVALVAHADALQLQGPKVRRAAHARAAAGGFKAEIAHWFQLPLVASRVKANLGGRTFGTNA
jgi:hypothetical protein